MWAQTQITKEAADAILECGIWREWPDAVIVRTQLFQKLSFIPFNIFLAALGRVLGRPVHISELGERVEEIQEEFANLKPEQLLKHIQV